MSSYATRPNAPAGPAYCPALKTCVPPSKLKFETMGGLLERYRHNRRDWELRNLQGGAVWKRLRVGEVTSVDNFGKKHTCAAGDLYYPMVAWAKLDMKRIKKLKEVQVEAGVRKVSVWTSHPTKPRTFICTNREDGWCIFNEDIMHKEQ
ncbi:uncharacterized protein PAC_01076 [Phialocephala subalpina]|uniref:Uncharacterized protein n=1 Tax=Phialocephala subalpina TaxID=576137 RepID=A0A1L7WEJ9_9HELO|nr:uncharacterized protein PAC_01076 [Phialocephala subalpina]